jgi:adenosylcobinamide-GDP ribazoletransferase
MSKSNAIKTFRDLLAFLTIIPLGKTEDFVSTSAKNMYLFPFIGALMGLFGAGYFLGAGLIVSYLLMAVNFVLHIPTDFLAKIIPAAMTLAFLLILTGFQHFDGLVDLGNALGLRKIEERREIAHRWVVTYRGALLAFFVEFSAFAGLFLLNQGLALRGLIVAEVCAKLAMVSIVWSGEAAHEGLGARFIRNAKGKRNIVAYASSLVIGYVLLGGAGVFAVSVASIFGLFMKQVGKSVFGGVSGDMIGATNEAARAVALVLTAAVFVLAPILFKGALLF